jgi:hypothetical protein
MYTKSYKQTYLYACICLYTHTGHHKAKFIQLLRLHNAYQSVNSNDSLVKHVLHKEDICLSVEIQQAFKHPISHVTTVWKTKNKNVSKLLIQGSHCCGSCMMEASMFQSNSNSRKMEETNKFMHAAHLCINLPHPHSPILASTHNQLSVTRPLYMTDTT